MLVFFLNPLLLNNGWVFIQVRRLEKFDVKITMVLLFFYNKAGMKVETIFQEDGSPKALTF